MKILAHLVLAWTLTAAAAPDLTTNDWRVELLAEEGIEPSKKAMKQALAGSATTQPTFEAAYQNLAAEEFSAREQAQREFLRGGREALEWLEDQVPSKDPEVIQRVTTITSALTSPHGQSRKSAVKHALRSLLAKEDDQGRNTGGILYEWFGEEKALLGKDYRLFHFESDAQRKGGVADGILALPGKQGGDGDQRLILRAEEWPGTKEIGSHFRVSAKIGGTEGGASAWHLGIAIGNVKAVYHPGHQGGGFRFEQITNARYLTTTESMKFTPSTKTMQWMTITARRLANGKVTLEATVEEGEEGPGRFQRSITVDAETIGDLDQVSLDRSGRTGGNALFDEFTLEVLAP